MMQGMGMQGTGLNKLTMTSALVLLGLVLVACGGESAPPDTPTVPPTLVPTLSATPPPTLTATENTSFVPTITPTFVNPEGTPITIATDTEFDVTPEVVYNELLIEAAEGQEVPAPINITLPEGWASTDLVVPLQDVDLSLNVLPASVYSGPVTGGTGYIIVLWGYSSVTSGVAPQINPGADGLRLLRLAVTDVGCVIGHDLNLDYEFRIGERIGLGTRFQAVQCPESADTRGWFAALNDEGMNYAFYAYAEPITAMDGPAEDELQAILDTVEFDLSNSLLIVTATPSGGQ